MFEIMRELIEKGDELQKLTAERKQPDYWYNLAKDITRRP